jgi:hypothetical protein
MKPEYPAGPTTVTINFINKNSNRSQNIKRFVYFLTIFALKAFSSYITHLHLFYHQLYAIVTNIWSGASVPTDLWQNINKFYHIQCIEYIILRAGIKLTT